MPAPRTVTRTDTEWLKGAAISRLEKRIPIESSALQRFEDCIPEVKVDLSEMPSYSEDAGMFPQLPVQFLRKIITQYLALKGLIIPSGYFRDIVKIDAFVYTIGDRWVEESLEIIKERKLLSPEQKKNKIGYANYDFVEKALKSNEFECLVIHRRLPNNLGSLIRWIVHNYPDYVSGRKSIAA